MEDTQPLDDLRVVDLTHAIAGPYCTMLLGCMGAEVIKVEASEGGDLFRPLLDSSIFISVNFNKRSMTVNLRTGEGRTILSKLVRDADVFVESFRPSVVEKLGFSYEVVSKLNPRIVYCSISGFGQSGPYREYPSYDPVIQAMCGLMMRTGEAGRPPVRVGSPVIDFGTGLLAAYGIMLCLLVRERTGVGQRVDVSLFDTAASWMGWLMAYYTLKGRVPERTGSGVDSITPYQVYETGDKPVFIGVMNDRFWRDFCQALGLRGIVDDPRFATNEARWANRDELTRILTGVFKKHSRDELVKKLVKTIPCGPVRDVDELIGDPHLVSRGMVVETARSDGKKAKTAGIPLKLSRTPSQIGRRPPTLGQHTEEILRELDYGEEEIRRFRKNNVI